MSRPLLSLVMMVKNEARSIREVLKAVKPIIDRWTILDTGSIDGTQAIVREVMGDVPGILVQEPFIDYATSRNRSLELNEMYGSPETRDEFTLMLSGDEFLRGELNALRDFLQTQIVFDRCDAFRIKVVVDDAETAYSPRVIRTGSKWRYEDGGAGVHEYLTHPDPIAAVGEIQKAWIDHVVSDPEKRLNNIWESHVPILKAKLEESPENPRALIFLARSYEALLDGPGFTTGEQISYRMEAMSLYLRRLELSSGTVAERNFLKMRFLDLAQRTGIYSPEEILSRASQLMLDDPLRPEVHLLHLQAAMRVPPIPTARIYNLAAEGARVAWHAKAIPNESPVSPSCCWQLHHIAAVAAKQIADRHPGEETREMYADAARTHAMAGVEAGGPPSLFYDFQEGTGPVFQEGPEETLSRPSV